MISRKNIHKLFYKIDNLLKKKGERRTFIIFGSSALMLQGLCPENRITMDIDLIEPKMDTTIQNISAEIGEQLGMDIQWLNSAGSIFAHHFPALWKSRTQQIFKGTALTVKTLSRKDLIAVKFYAYCERNLRIDKDDLILLKPSQKELSFAKDWLVSLKKHFEIEHINSQFEEILHSLGDKKP